MIFQPDGPGFAELAAGIDLAHQCVRHGGCACLTAQIAVDTGPEGCLREHKRRTAGEHQNHVFVSLTNLRNQGVLGLGQIHVGSVHAFGFQDFVQTYAQQNYIGPLRQSYGFCNQFAVRFGLIAVKALGKACDIQPRARDAVQQMLHLCGIDQTGACALIPGGGGKITDEGHFRSRLQRQNAVVFQKDDGTGGTFLCQRVMGFPVKGFGLILHRVHGGQDHTQQFPNPFIDKGFGDPAFPDCPDKAHGAIRAGGGHHKIGACPDTFHMVVVAAPVRHHEAVKAPLPAQDFRQQMVVFVGVFAIDHVVAGHDGFGFALRHSDLKACQVDFTKGPFVHHGVHGHTPQFLGIHREMLGAGGDAVFLDAPDIGGSHFAGQIGIF